MPVFFLVGGPILAVTMGVFRRRFHCDLIAKEILYIIIGGFDHHKGEINRIAVFKNLRVPIIRDLRASIGIHLLDQTLCVTPNIIVIGEMPNYSLNRTVICDFIAALAIRGKNILKTRDKKRLEILGDISSVQIIVSSSTWRGRESITYICALLVTIQTESAIAVVKQDIRKSIFQRRDRIFRSLRSDSQRIGNQKCHAKNDAENPFHNTHPRSLKYPIMKI